jgi:hypothetical protein
MFGVAAYGCWVGKYFVLFVAGETEVIVKISFNQLKSACPSMGIMAVKAGNLGLEVGALVEVKPLLEALPVFRILSG